MKMKWKDFEFEGEDKEILQFFKEIMLRESEN